MCVGGGTPREEQREPAASHLQALPVAHAVHLSAHLLREGRAVPATWRHARRRLGVRALSMGVSHQDAFGNAFRSARGSGKA